MPVSELFQLNGEYADLKRLRKRTPEQEARLREVAKRIAAWDLEHHPERYLTRDGWVYPVSKTLAKQLGVAVPEDQE